MSYWGATVITNLVSVIPWVGDDLVKLIWGGFSINNATLNRFFSLHYLMPFILVALVILHLLALHINGSNNPEGINSYNDSLRFHPYYTSKDVVGFLFMMLIFMIVLFYVPNYLGHPDNYIQANPMVTPHSIVPEWYFLPFYAILRAIPNRTGGVIAMGGSLVILFFLNTFQSLNLRSNQYKPVLRFLFWIFIMNFFFLINAGGKPIAQPFILFSQIGTVIYFLYFIVLILIGEL